MKSTASSDRSPSTKLRVLDLGTVNAWRSQSSWHGIASAMRPESTPTLSFCRPAEPYVGLGYHRSLAEIDLDACRRLGLPVIRRQIGGGPVYLDSDQLFFQITLPAHLAPPRVDHLYERLLEPAAAALRALGLEARRNGLNDLTVGDPRSGPRKISGTGAGRIDDGVTVVGNVLFRFPHRRMASVLALPTESMRSECLRLMRCHVSSLAAEGLGRVSFEEARTALADAYARALGKRPVSAALSEPEKEAIGRWEERFRDPAWLAGPPGPPQTVRQVKVSGDAWVTAARTDGIAVETSVVRGRMERVSIAAARLTTAAEMERAVAGRPARPEPIRRALEPFGEDGRRLAKLLESAFQVR